MTRKDLSPGYQAVQPSHALSRFAIQHYNTFKEWQKNHKNLVILSVNNESELYDLLNKATMNGLKVSWFKEPDIDDQLTAIALEPNDLTYRITSSIPLALREESHAVAG